MIQRLLYKRVTLVVAVHNEIRVKILDVRLCVLIQTYQWASWDTFQDSNMFSFEESSNLRSLETLGERLGDKEDVQEEAFTGF